MGFLKSKTGNSKVDAKSKSKTGAVDVKEKSKPEKSKPEKSKPEKSKPEKSKPEKSKPETPEGKPQKVQNFQCCRSPITVIIVSVLAVVGFAAAITAIALLLLKKDVFNTGHSESQKTKQICDTPDCVTLAYQLHNWKDPKTDPCDDFYQHSCGRFMEYSIGESPVHDKKGTITRLMKKFLKTKVYTGTSNTEILMIGLYKMCQQEATGSFVQGWKDAVAEIQSHTKFPMLTQNWNSNMFNLNKAIVLMAKYGVENFGLFRLFFYSGHQEKAIGVMYPFSREDDPKIDYKTKIIDMLNAANIAHKSANIQTKVQNAVDLLKKLSKMETRLPEKGKTIADLNAAVPQIDFRNMFRQILDIPQAMFDEKVGAFPYELFFGPNMPLADFLSKPSNAETVANALFLKLFEKLFADFKPVDDCTERVMAKMPRAALRYFTRNYAKKENRKVMSDLIEDVRNSYIDTFKKNTWMDESTRQSAIQKVEMMQKIVGYGEEYEPEGTLDAMYDDFMINVLPTTSSYFSLVQAINDLHTQHHMQFMFSDSKFDTTIGILQVNAFYEPLANRFNMLIPFLDDPFFDISFPKYAQLAGMGRVIGHEIGHGFDNLGRKFNAKGDEQDWWTTASRQTYDQKAQCLVEQYDNYDDPDYGKMAGAPRLGENLADLIGLQVLWNAYKKSDPSNALKLSGFEDYPVDKLFWQIGALMWCQHRENPENHILNVANDGHAVNRFRVNGLYQNMPGFSETFNCPMGSPMNPMSKCSMF